MSVHYKIKALVALYTLFIIVSCCPQKCIAQRFSHSNGGGGGGFRPTAPMVTHTTPAINYSTRSTAFNHSVETPVARATINGGSLNNGNHNLNRSNTANVTIRPTTVNQNVPQNVNMPQKANVSQNVNALQKEHTNLNVHENVNVYHSRNQSSLPYSNHPYHPSYWGPSWHPRGFFTAALDAAALYFNIASQAYYYDDGLYYEPASGGYTVVSPPLGAIVNSLPNGYEIVQVGYDYFDYYAGTFYVSTDQGYQVVAAPIGAVVTEIPDGATEQNINGESYLIYDNTYFLPVSQNGQDAYEVVQVN